MTVTYALLQTGTAVFAVTGVLAAARQNMDVLSLIVIGVVTAVGGGTIRDLLLDVPVFWLADPTYLGVSALAALATFFLERRFRATERALLYLDGIATALFAVLATDKALALGHSTGVALVMGVITGIGGGLLRDVITGHATILLRRELYMTPILVGGLLYIQLRAAAILDPGRTILIAVVLIAAVRIGAIRFDWEFPGWLTYRRIS
jgi:uncharacterized membrane protein YeiH